MYILFISSSYPRYKDRIKGIFVHEQALALKERGHQVGVLVPNYPYPSRLFDKVYSLRDSTRLFMHDGIPVLNYLFLPVPFIHQLLTRLLTNLALKKYMKEFGRPDIIHGHFVFYGGIIGMIIKNTLDIPLVLNLHSAYFFEEDASRYRKRIIQKVLEHSDKVIAVSRFLEEKIRKNFRNIHIEIVPNTIDTDFFDCSKIKEPGIPFTYTGIGRLNKLKNFDKLILAFSKLPEKSKMRVNIIGSGDERGNLESLTKQLGLEEYIHFPGRVKRNRMRDIYERTHVVVSTSNLETFGMTLIEALSCGIPVLATRCGGPEEIINKGNGILVDKNNLDQIRWGLAEIYRKYDQFDAEKIRRECIQKYGHEAVADKITKIYQDLSA